MPVAMRSTNRNTDEVLDAERLRQIARRKEQNRNAQRRLRERKEEYTMQLEAQLADLHRRAQSQEEESHFLREALARMRAENQTLAEQIACIHQAVPSTQTSHPLPQRASVDLGVDVFVQSVPHSRIRHRSQSFTSTAMQNLGLGPTSAPWSTSQHPMHTTHPVFGSTIAPSATHRTSLASGSSVSGPSFANGLPLPSMDSTDESLPQSEEASRRSSFSPLTHRRSSTLLSPFDARAHLSRHGSDLTELTVPTDHSDSEQGPSTKIQRAYRPPSVVGPPLAPSPSSLGSAANRASKATTGAAARAETSDPSAASAAPMAPSSDEVMANCMDSIHSMPFGATEAVKPAAAAPTPPRMQYDGSASWMSTGADMPGQLALPEFRHSDLAALSKSMGMTPGALGLSNMMGGNGAAGDGWTISPWINMAQTPSTSAGADAEAAVSQSQADGQQLDAGMAFDSRRSLAARRGFSGSLKLESQTL